MANKQEYKDFIERSALEWLSSLFKMEVHDIKMQSIFGKDLIPPTSGNWGENELDDVQAEIAAFQKVISKKTREKPKEFPVVCTVKDFVDLAKICYDLDEAYVEDTLQYWKHCQKQKGGNSRKKKKIKLITLKLLEFTKSLFRSKGKGSTHEP